jgi:hypothetical protein
VEQALQVGFQCKFGKSDPVQQGTPSDEDRAYLREEEEQLREKEKQLHCEKDRFLEQKNKLIDQQNMFIKREDRLSEQKGSGVFHI